ncbi:Na+/H+ antiporter NhaA [Romboutsia sp.]|uniref:Na+/H+ antiporter NhaA n=1 Tax=Romboutsia sp. TaxID=1965302 RepID=UPI003F3509A4
MRFLRNYRKPIKIELFTSTTLIIATVSALVIYNSSFRGYYDYILNNFYITRSLSIHNFINEFLMSIFFLVAGLEIKHELLYGNLSTFKKASFPVIASIGGVIFPALIYIAFNKNTPFINGFCIPISTDIAFAVGIFLIFSKRFNPSLKIFLLSLAVVDDLVSIIAIGTIYSLRINLIYVAIAILILVALLIANKVFMVESTLYYLISGLCLWYFVHLAGIHSTISGILLAIVIPSNTCSPRKSCLERLQGALVPFNSLVIMPLFAFANTGISINYNFLDLFNDKTLVYGIVFGLCIGKPLGIMSFSYIGSLLGIAEKPNNISWLGVFFVSLIAGIGFTMSIFVSEIAFVGNINLINLAKISILLSCVISILFSIISILLYILFNKLIRKNKASLINTYYIN